MTMKLNSLAIAVGISVALAASSSHALLISSSVESSVAITLNGVTNQVTDGPGSSTNSSLWEHPDHRYVGGGEATGTEEGVNSLRSEGPWYAQIDHLYDNLPLEYQTVSKVTHKAVITNDSSTAQNIDFDFLIDQGFISHGWSSIYGNADDFVTAGYSANISLNGNSLWYSAGESRADFNDYSLSLSGINMGGTASNGTYSWDNFAGNLNLGLLNAGQAITLEYSLATYVNEYFQERGYSYTPHARIGDPFNFNTTPVFSPDNFIVTPADPGNPTDVPEPAGTLLLGAGLAALAFRRRKERKTTL